MKIIDFTSVNDRPPIPALRNNHMKYGRYISANKSTLMVRVPDCDQINFHKSKLTEAIATRDKLCESVGRNPYEKFNHQADRIHVVCHIDKRERLPVGVCLSYHTRKLVSGYKVYESVSAAILLNGKQVKKTFSVNKFGKEKAIRLAKDWRIEAFKAKYDDTSGCN